ncbi:MAG: T9SS C-terminal target domain-containing protein [Bacteroidetes bacterium]|nr:MAG: T9SS C-terminal target domain-containing protein [Bacteroidota bacterium]
MKHIYIRKLFLLLLLVFAFGIKAQNSGLVGADISYQSLGNNKYQFEVSVLRDCESVFQVQNTQSLSYISSLCGISGSFNLFLVNSEVIATCEKGVSKCDGGNIRSFQKKTFQGVVTLPQACRDYKFRWIGFNRANSPTTFVNTVTSMSIEALLNTVDAPNNSSPKFASKPLNFVSKNYLTNYLPSVSDVNSDLLTFSSIAPQNSLGQNISYLPGFSASQPVSSSSAFSINSGTGEINFTPTQDETSAIVMRATETRNGNLIGYVTREMRIEVLTNSAPPPTVSGIDGLNVALSLNSCVGKPISFFIDGKSLGNATMKMELLNPPAGSSFRTIASVGAVRGNFSWTPSTVGIQQLQFKVSDGLCPYEGTTTKIITIDVKQIPQISLNVPLSTTVSDCNVPLNVLVIPTVSSGNNFTWFDASDLTQSIATTKNYNVTKPAQYKFFVSDAFGCGNNITVEFLGKLVVDFTYDDFNSCKNKKTKFQNFSYTNDFTQQTVITGFTWDFGDGSPLINTTATQRDTAHVYATDGIKNVKLTGRTNNGCVVTTSKNIKVYTKPIPNVIIGPKYICESPGFVEIVGTLTGYNTTLGGIENYKFVFDNGAQTFNNQVVKYSTTNSVVGIKFVGGINNCKDSITITRNVNKKPQFINVTPNFIQVCTIPSYPNLTLVGLGTPVSNALAISNILKYKWVTTKGIFNTPEQLPIVLNNISKTYFLDIEDTLGCINTTSIGINAGIDAKFKYDSYYCKEGDLVSISDVSTVRGIPAKWSWDLVILPSVSGTNSIPTPQTFTGIPNTLTGKFDVTLYLEDQYGCKDTAIYPMLRYLPKFNKTAISKNQLCFKEPLNLFGTPSAGLDDANNVNYWKWEYGDGANSSNTLINHTDYRQNNSANIIERVIGGSKNVYADTAFFISHTYSLSGIYTIKHTVGYNDGSFFITPNSLSLTLPPAGCIYVYTTTSEVYPELKYIFADPINKCAGTPTEFIASRANTGNTFTVMPDKFKWEFNKLNGLTPPTSFGTIVGNNNGDTTKVIKTFTEGGTVNFGLNPYVVQLTVEDIKGCKGIFKDSIDNAVIPQPKLINPAQACQNSLVIFNIEDALENNILSTVDNIWYFEDSDIIYEKRGVRPAPKFKSSPLSIKNYAVTFVGGAGFEKCFTTVSGTYTTNISPSTTFEIPANWCSNDVLTISPVLTSNTSDVSVESLQNFWTFPDKSTQNNLKSTFTKSLKTGRDTITVITLNPLNSCTDTTRKVVNVLFSPKADFTFASTDPADKQYVFSTSDIKFSDRVSTVDGSNTTTKTWDWANGTITKKGGEPFDTVFSYQKSAIFNVKYVIKNTDLCTDSITKKVDLTSFLKMPNAFYPNPEDPENVNSSFGVYQNGIKNLQVFQIFNRWGQIVFETTSTNEKWNGKNNNKGADCPAGVYMYRVKATTGYNEGIDYKGQVTLIR